MENKWKLEFIFAAKSGCSPERDSKYYFEIFVQIPYSTSEITTGVILND
jgi:hypothetical protein